MSNLFIRLSVAYTFVFISLSSLFAQKKEEFYRGAQALEGFGLLSGTAQDRSAQRDTSRKFWFER